MWILSVAHITNLQILALIEEVFKDGNNSGEELKKITAGLFQSKGSILKHLNLSGADNFDQVDQVIETFMSDFSHRIENYLY